jgi:hypothetical protein
MLQKRKNPEGILHTIHQNLAYSSHMSLFCELHQWFKRLNLLLHCVCSTLPSRASQLEKSKRYLPNLSSNFWSYINGPATAQGQTHRDWGLAEV